MLNWVKKRVREFEGFDWHQEHDRPFAQGLNGDERKRTPTPRREYIKAAIEDWQWMTAGSMTVEEQPV